MLVKNIKGGRNRGEIEQLSDEEKVPHAVQKAASAHVDYTTNLVWVPIDRVKFDAQSVSPRGLPLKKKWKNNVYNAAGKAAFRLHILKTNKYMEPKVRDFKISFQDTLDGMGQPDIKVLSFELRP